MAERKTKGGVRSRLLICMIAFTVLTVALLWISQNLLLEPIYRANKINEVKDAAKEIVQSAESDSFSEAVTEIAKKYGICVRIESEEHTFEPISVDVTGSCIIHRIKPDDVSELYNDCRKNEGGIMYLSDKGDKGSDNIIIMATKTEYKNDTAIILLNSAVVPVGATVDTMNTLLVFVTVIMILLSLVLTFILSGVITKPIISITKGADALARGEYGSSFKGRGYREAERLADTLNYAKDELQKTDRLQKELIANISHDIRTPLTMISGYSQMMRDIPDENNDKNLQIIIDETERLSELVTDVLDLSKLQAGTKKMNFEPLELSSLTEKALERFSKLSGKCSITLEECESVTIPGDRTGILQVIYNLVNNAVNHTPPEGRVTVNISRIGDYARLSVTDTGEGIPPEMLENIWQRYYKADSNTRQSAGTGLGLSIVKEIMQKHGGYYGVSSTVGVGSIFWVDFPIYGEQLNPTPKETEK